MQREGLEPRFDEHQQPIQAGVKSIDSLPSSHGTGWQRGGAGRAGWRSRQNVNSEIYRARQAVDPGHTGVAVTNIDPKRAAGPRCSVLNHR